MSIEIDENRIKTDTDYVAIKRYGYSLQKLVTRYEDGCPTHIIAKALFLTEEQVEQRYQQIVLLLRKQMGV
jgi:hypothetical protein